MVTLFSGKTFIKPSEITNECLSVPSKYINSPVFSLLNKAACFGNIVISPSTVGAVI